MSAWDVVMLVGVAAAVGAVCALALWIWVGKEMDKEHREELRRIMTPDDPSKPNPLEPD